MYTMNGVLYFVAAMFLGMLICLETGHRLGIRRLARDPQGAKHGLGVVEGAVFGLYGLLLAFTFSGAPARLDARRQLIAEEANAIGTAWMRLDLLPADSQPALREHFRNYLDSRLAVYRKVPDMEAVKKELAKSGKLQQDMWSEAVAATGLSGSRDEGSLLLLPALNQMIDITTTRAMATQMHPPLIIFALLFLLALVCSVLVGYGLSGGKQRSWMHMAAFAVITVLSVYVVLEIEYPRLGFVHLLDVSDQVLVELRASM